MPEVIESASIAAALGVAVQQLERGGIPHARREATALWAACDDVRPADVFLRRQEAADPATVARFQDAVERRSAGAPFAYVIGRAAFRSLDLATDPRALIPRPETEGLVELILEWVRTSGVAGGVAVDVATGSGCIALALAVEGPFDRVIGLDISPDAITLARENLARVKPPPHVPVELLQGDLLQPLEVNPGRRFRVIVSNPPYLTDGEWEALDPSVKAYEPRLALVSGEDGLAATRVILAEAQQLLEPGRGGLLALEIDERRAEQVRNLAVELEWQDVTVHQDLFGRLRYLLAHPSSEGGA